jgi:hypothetical protein
MNLSRSLRLAFVLATFAVAAANNGRGESAVTSVEIGPKNVRTAVPEIVAQGRALAPQAVSAVDISADRNFITIGTMAFSHEAKATGAPAGCRVVSENFSLTAQIGFSNHRPR